MGAARAAFDEAKHPRGFHGRFGSGGGVVRRFSDREHVMENLSVGNRSGSAFQPHRQPSQERARKKAIRVASELPRGLRQPASWKEEESLNWASPQKRAAQRALTGDVQMPRQDALHKARTVAGGFRHTSHTTGTRRTFAGKTMRVRETVPPRGARMTVRGKFNLGKYGRD